MTNGRVTVAALNVRSSAGGTVSGLLRQGAVVTITGAAQGNWLPISAMQDGKTIAGFVANAFIAREALAPAAALAAVPMPMPDDPAHPVRVIGKKAVGPDGVAFAFKQTQGFYTTGLTSVGQWAAGQTVPPSLSSSVLRVLIAVAQNEAGFEGLNSYDACFLSFGFQQWTLAQDTEPGELPALLALLRSQDAAAFEDCFGRYGLTVELTPGPSDALRTGLLVLHGALVDSAALKAPFRDADWAYRFWRAGHHPSTRQCQVMLAAERIGLARDKMIEELPVSAWLTSEHGVALLLDEHVNRPSHVPGTLAEAVTSVLIAGADANPETWGDQQEASLIEAYTMAREHTTMTDAALRARKISDSVLAGKLSDKRGSFETAPATTGLVA